jgi:hypothetical protein
MLCTVPWVIRSSPGLSSQLAVSLEAARISAGAGGWRGVPPLSPRRCRAASSSVRSATSRAKRKVELIVQNSNHGAARRRTPTDQHADAIRGDNVRFLQDAFNDTPEV